MPSTINSDKHLFSGKSSSGIPVKEKKCPLLEILTVKYQDLQKEENDFTSDTCFLLIRLKNIFIILFTHSFQLANSFIF